MKRQETKPKDTVRRPTGSLKIVIREVKTGKVVREINLGNVVVNNLRTQELSALAGVDLADRAITRIQVGTSGTAETVTDVAITAPVDVAVVATYPADGQMQFTGTLGAAQGNGITFLEAGLVFFNVAPNLVTRRTFDGIAKTNAFEWDLTWNLNWL